MVSVVLDMATAGAASKLLDPEKPIPPRDKFSDIDIAAASQLLEALILFDGIILPDLGNQRDVREVAAPLGTAIIPVDVEYNERERLAKAVRDWLGSNARLADLVRAAGATPRYTRIETSGEL